MAPKFQENPAKENSFLISRTITLPLRWICICKGSASSKLIVPDLPRSLSSFHSAIIVPPIGVETNTQLKIATIVDRSVDIKSFKHLDPIIPQLVLLKN